MSIVERLLPGVAESAHIVWPVPRLISTISNSLSFSPSLAATPTAAVTRTESSQANVGETNATEVSPNATFTTSSSTAATAGTTSVESKPPFATSAAPTRPATIRTKTPTLSPNPTDTNFSCQSGPPSCTSAVAVIIHQSVRNAIVAASVAQAVTAPLAPGAVNKAVTLRRTLQMWECAGTPRMPTWESYVWIYGPSWQAEWSIALVSSAVSAMAAVASLIFTLSRGYGTASAIDRPDVSLRTPIIVLGRVVVWWHIIMLCYYAPNLVGGAVAIASHATPGRWSNATLSAAWTSLVICSLWFGGVWHVLVVGGRQPDEPLRIASAPVAAAVCPLLQVPSTTTVALSSRDVVIVSGHAKKVAAAFYRHGLKALWEDARDVRSIFHRAYGIADVTVATIVAAITAAASSTDSACLMGCGATLALLIVQLTALAWIRPFARKWDHIWAVLSVASSAAVALVVTAARFAGSAASDKWIPPHTQKKSWIALGVF